MWATTCLAGHHVADLGMQLRDPAGEFRADIDLVSLQPAVAEAYAGGQKRLGMLPPIEAGAACGQKNGKSPDQEPRPPRLPQRCKRYDRR